MPQNKDPLSPQRPAPITSELQALGMTKDIPPKYAVEELLNGSNIIIDDFYGTGLNLLAELKTQLGFQYKGKTFSEQREFRQAYYRYSRNVLLEISKHKICVKKSPKIGWLNILYSDLSDFILRFPDVQGLNSSWQWYSNGIYIPVLNKKIYPYYNCYFPTRFEHLELLDKYLKSYIGNKRNAYDIGTGSSIIAQMLALKGFQEVYATDINPNALIGLREAIEKNRAADIIQTECGDLFAGFEEQSELIVFNPPWLPSELNSKGIDAAVYYNDDLFERFFEQAKSRLAEDGKIVLLFSNLAQITNTSSSHPIKYETEQNKRFATEHFETLKVKTASKKTRRVQEHRKHEFVELWVLKHR